MALTIALVAGLAGGALEDQVVTEQLPEVPVVRIQFEQYPRRRVIADVGEGDRTKQAPTEQTDINVIVKRYSETGIAGHLNPQMAQYGDFSEAADYHEALTRVRAAQEQFELLPAHVREHVDNDPGKFLELISDEDRRDELEELGLLQDPDAKVVPVRLEGPLPGQQGLPGTGTPDTPKEAPPEPQTPPKEGG